MNNPTINETAVDNIAKKYFPELPTVVAENDVNLLPLARQLYVYKSEIIVNGNYRFRIDEVGSQVIRESHEDTLMRLRQRAQYRRTPLTFLYSLLETNFENKNAILKYFPLSITETINTLVRDVDFETYKLRLFAGQESAQRMAVEMEEKWVCEEVPYSDPTSVFYNPNLPYGGIAAVDWHSKPLTEEKVQELINLYIPLANRLGARSLAESMGKALAGSLH